MWFYRFIKKITEPHASVEGPLDRKVAQFIATFHLATVPLAPLALIIRSYTTPDAELTFGWSLAPVLCALLNYQLARSKWFVISIYLQISSAIGVIYYTALLVPDRQSIHFAFLIPILLANILLSLRSAIAVTASVFVVMLSLFVFMEPSHQQLLMGSAFVVLILSGLVVFMRSHRNSVEEIRLEQIQLQQQKYLTIFDASFDGITLIQNGRFKQVSDGFAALFDLRANDLEETKVGDVLPAHLFEQSDAVQNKVYKLKNGEIRHFQVVREFTGVNELMIALRDVTEIQEQQTRKLMMDRMTSTATLAVGIAHELNTPLMIAMNQTQMALQKVTQLEIEDESLEQQLLVTQDVLDTIGDILNDIRWFVNLKDSRTEDVNTVIRNTIRLARHRIQHKVKIIFSLSDVLPIHISENQLSQTLINLLINAADAKKPGPEPCVIKISSGMKDNGNVEIVVSDNGIGIAESDLDRVFEPFYTTKSNGNGLGLAICHELVKHNGGDIKVSSVTNSGSHFSMLFKTAPEKDFDEEDNSVSADSHEILVVEDDPILREIIIEMLLPHKAIGSNSVSDALSKIAEDEFELIICDVIMPQQGAIDLFQSLDANNHMLSNKMLFITGGITDRKISNFVQVQNIPVLYKPFNRKNLHRSVESLV